MSTFPKIITSFLKKILLPRAPDCKFTVQDVETIVDATGLSAEQTRNWAAKFCASTPRDIRADLLQKDIQFQKCPEVFVPACRCAFDYVWVDYLNGIVFYPRSRLVSWRGLLLCFETPMHWFLGIHKLGSYSHFHVSGEHVTVLGQEQVRIKLRGTGPNRICYSSLEGVGVQRVRRMQRWWRKQLLKKKQERQVAFMMATHARLGAASGLRHFDNGVIRMCAA